MMIANLLGSAWAGAGRAGSFEGAWSREDGDWLAPAGLCEPDCSGARSRPIPQEQSSQTTPAATAVRRSRQKAGYRTQFFEKLFTASLPSRNPNFRECVPYFMQGRCAFV